MVAALAAGAVANAHDGRKIVAARRFGQQPDFVAAVLYFKVERLQIAVRQGRVAFASVIARVAAGNGADGDQIAPDRDFHFVIHLEADVALPLAQRHVIARHAPDLEPRVGQRGKGGAQGGERHAVSRKSANPHCFKHTAAMDVRECPGVSAFVRAAADGAINFPKDSFAPHARYIRHATGWH